MNMHVTILSPDAIMPRQVWDELVARRDAAKQALERFNTTVLNPLDEELDRLAPHPDLHFTVEAANGQTARYFLPADELDRFDNHWSPLVQRKAAQLRGAWLSYLTVRDRLGWDAACEESERLCSVQCDLEHELVVMPAPDQAALLWKLEHLFGLEARNEDDFCAAWCASFINTVMEDARRFLVAGAEAWNPYQR
jgi:hypothetical protein